MTTVIPGSNCLNPVDNLKGVGGWGTTGDTPPPLPPPPLTSTCYVKNKTERKPEDNRGVSSEY